MLRRDWISLAALSCVLPSAHRAHDRAIEQPVRIEQALDRLKAKFPEIVADPARYRLKICASFPANAAWQHEHYRAAAEWSAPASMVKLPIAMFTLLRMRQLGLDRDAQLRILDPPSCAAQANELLEFESLSRSLARMLIVSDNGAFNRLYEFVGGDRVPSLLRRFGNQDSVLQARLGACSALDNASGRGFELRSDAHSPVLRFAPPHSIAIRKVEPTVLVGNAHYDLNEQLVQAPRDFSQSNHFRLNHSHALVAAMAGALEHPLWSALHPDDRQFLCETMATLPKDAGFNTQEYPDNWGKFLAAGDQPALLGNGLKSTNKIGQAYGFLTDCAWLQQGNKQIVLSASIYVNADGVLNDDQYEYESLGIPFLAALGRELLAQA